MHIQYIYFFQTILNFKFHIFNVEYVKYHENPFNKLHLSRDKFQKLEF